MAWAPAYITAADLKAYLRIVDILDDAEIALAIAAASRAVDRHTNRQFGIDDVAAERLYAARYDQDRSRWVIDIDDLFGAPVGVAADTVNGDEPITSFVLEPHNANTNGFPYTRIVVGRDSTAQPHRDQVEQPVGVTATFGWSTVPQAIEQATLLQASRFLARREAPFGVAGSPEVGSEVRLLARVDADVSVALGPYVRWWGAV